MIVLLALPTSALADGGTVRLSERHGAYQITVFTAPTPVRAGTLDISVLVQNAASGDAVTDVPMDVTVAAAGGSKETFIQSATAAAATNKLFRSAMFQLPHGGRWEVSVAVGDGAHAAKVQFDIEAAPPLPQWLTLWPWFLWPLAVVALFGVHLALVERRRRDVNSGARLLRARLS